MPGTCSIPAYRENATQYLLNTKDRQGEEDYFCAKSCAAASRWLRENKDNGGPFMLFVDMFDPHEPWDAPPRFQQHVPRRNTRWTGYLFGYGVDRRDIRDDDIPDPPRPVFGGGDLQRSLRRQAPREVKRLGLWDNTIVAFSTDHGTHLGEQGCVQKQAKLLNSCVAPRPAHHPSPGPRLPRQADRRVGKPSGLHADVPLAAGREDEPEVRRRQLLGPRRRPQAARRGRDGIRQFRLGPHPQVALFPERLGRLRRPRPATLRPGAGSRGRKKTWWQPPGKWSRK